MPTGQITGRPRLPYAEPKSFFGGRPPATLPGAVKPDPVPRRTRGSPGLTSWALLAPDEHCPPRRGCDQDSQARFRPLGCQGSGRQLHLLEPPTRRVPSPLPPPPPPPAPERNLLRWLVSVDLAGPPRADSRSDGTFGGSVRVSGDEHSSQWRTRQGSAHRVGLIAAAEGLSRAEGNPPAPRALSPDAFGPQGSTGSSLGPQPAGLPQGIWVYTAPRSQERIP